jgi:hypothetical protein
MEQNFALQTAETEAGFILTCQSHPTTPTVAVDYDSCANTYANTARRPHGPPAPPSPGHQVDRGRKLLTVCLGQRRG